MYTEEQINLINRIFTLFIDAKTSTEAWGFYIFEQEFAHEQELRNRLGVVWLASLFDSIHADSVHIDKYKRQAVELEIPHMQRYCEQARVFFSSIKMLVEKFSKEEQVFITYLRNQYAHSYLNGRHNESIGIKYVEGGEFKTETLTRDEYHGLTRELFEKDNLDVTLAELISRIDNKKDLFFFQLGELQANANLIQESMLKGHEVQLKTIDA